MQIILVDDFLDHEFKIKLKKIDSEKDVCVTFSSDLKFNEHITMLLKKLTRLLASLKGHFLTLILICSICYLNQL